MLKYTFSTREKALIVILAVIVLALLWYTLIFQNIDNQVKKVESDIATAQDKLAVDNAKLAQQKNMQDAIDRYVASGARIVPVPKYDNIQNVMTQLNVVLAGTSSFTMTFDDIKTTQSNTIERGVSLNFGCASYADAVNVLTNLARGPYPCRITECSISSSSNVPIAVPSGGNAVAYTVTAHLVYIENMR